MSKEQINIPQKTSGQENSNTDPNTGDQSSCCGPEMTDMMAQCPCCSFIKKHWLLGFGIFLLMLLMLIISQVGGVLGIIAFFRTL